ncbi:MAG: hypothetical protein WCY98_02975 [Castellaniella sp.]
MHFIIQILAVILIGTSIGTLISRRNAALVLGGGAGIAFGVATLLMVQWWPLAVGTAIFLAGHAMQRDHRKAQAAA